MSIIRSGLFLLVVLSFQHCKNQPPANVSSENPKVEKAVAEPAPRFTCLGTEPFWYVKIEPDSGIIYNQMDEGITRFPYRLPRKEGGKTIFESELPGSKIRVTIESAECSDGMSDETYPYTSEVEKDQTKLSGCAK